MKIDSKQQSTMSKQLCSPL